MGDTTALLIASIVCFAVGASLIAHWLLTLHKAILKVKPGRLSQLEFDWWNFTFWIGIGCLVIYVGWKVLPIHFEIVWEMAH